MTTIGNPTYAVRDSMTMLRRNIKHQWRYPVLTMMVAGIPIVILLLFVYVFGDTMGAGLSAGMAGLDVSAGGNFRTEYANYLTPGILMLGVAGVAQGTSITVAMDMTEGIIARFRTMAIARVSVLTGHVVGSIIQMMVGLVLVVGAALLVGFRPNATPVEWLTLVGLLLLVALAITWFSVGCGLVSKTVEAASNLPMPLILLPFLGSGFVPTDSMPGPMRWFAENQPFTPIMETVRGLLMGTEIGNSAIVAVAWCVGIALVSYLWAKKLYNRKA